MVFPNEPQTQDKYQQYSDMKKAQRTLLINNIINNKFFTDIQRKELENFHNFIKRKELRLESQRAYLQHLKLFFEFFKKPTDKINRQDIDKYLAYLQDTFKPKTITERKKFLLLYFEYYYQKTKSEIPLIKDIIIKREKNNKLPEELLTPEEIKKMVQVADNTRDKAIIMLLYESGARKGEFMQLKIKHVDIRESDKKKFGFITIPQGKTESRKIPIIYSMPYLLNWLNSHPNRDDPNAPLFITLGSYLGQAFGEDGLKRRLVILGKRAGIKKKIYPHLLRHSRLTELAKELTEQELKKFAGWTPDSGMASTYIHLSGQDVTDKILANAGLIDVKFAQKGRTILMQIECPSCKKLNPSDSKYCDCGRILSIKEAHKQLEEYQSMEDRLKSMEKNQQEQIKAILKLIRSKK